MDTLVLNGKKIIPKKDSSWDYKGKKIKGYSHGLHTYPAMFIPQIARRLIENYSEKGDIICDIFCGSGTALVESRLLGRNSWGIDLNPLAIFLAQVKTKPLDPILLQKNYFQLMNKFYSYSDKDIKKPDFFNIDFWFKPDVIVQLAKFKKTISEIKNQNIQNFFKVTFSETVRLSSNMKSGEFKLCRIKKELLDDYNPNVVDIFKKKVESNILGMSEFYKDVDKNTWVKIMEADTTKPIKIPNKSVDLIITSPPYGDSRTTVAYGQFSRLSLQWIDIASSEENNHIDKKLLGGKPVKELIYSLNSLTLSKTISLIASKDQKRAKEVLPFYLDLEKCLKQAYRILKDGSSFCLVVGNRTVKGIQLPTDHIIAEMGEKIGFKLQKIIVRNIPSKRMPLKTSPTNIPGKLEKTMHKENIIILKKEKLDGFL